MLECKSAKVNPEMFNIVEGISYLFYDASRGNTLLKLIEKGREEGAKRFVRTADRQGKR